jgi:hypothetical protein
MLWLGPSLENEAPGRIEDARDDEFPLSGFHRAALSPAAMFPLLLQLPFAQTILQTIEAILPSNGDNTLATRWRP